MDTIRNLFCCCQSDEESNGESNDRELQDISPRASTVDQTSPVKHEVLNEDPSADSNILSTVEEEESTPLNLQPQEAPPASSSGPITEATSISPKPE